MSKYLSELIPSFVVGQNTAGTQFEEDSIVK